MSDTGKIFEQWGNAAGFFALDRGAVRASDAEFLTFVDAAVSVVASLSALGIGTSDTLLASVDTVTGQGSLGQRQIALAESLSRDCKKPGGSPFVEELYNSAILIGGAAIRLGAMREDQAEATTSGVRRTLLRHLTT